MNNFSLSVITVSYNAIKTIEKTILSVVNQSYPNIEYIVIDGGSTDGTLDIIKKYQDKIAYWVSEPDKGIYDAMNKGINKANGDYLFFLGADDILIKDSIQEIFESITIFPVLIYGNVIYNKNINSVIKSKFSYKTYLHNTIHHQAAFYHKILFRNFRYNTDFKITSDYELNLLIFLNHKTNTLYKNIIVSDCKDDGVSRLNASIAQKEMMQIRRKYFNAFKNFFFDILSTIKFKLYRIIR